MMDSITMEPELRTIMDKLNMFNEEIVQQDDFYKVFVNNPSSFINILNRFNKEAVYLEVLKIIQKCIFNKKMKIFDNYLTGFFEKSEEKEKHSLPKYLIKFLINSYSNEDSSLIFKLIFDSFATAYNDFELVYKMFIIILEIIGFSIKPTFNLIKISKLQTPNTSLNKSSEILLNMLITVLNKCKVTDHKLNELNFSDFMKELIKCIIHLTVVPNRCCYNILLTTLSINELIIEPIINDVIGYTMLNCNNNVEEYQELQLKIFEIFAKLHRIQSLISKMIPTFKSLLIDNNYTKTTVNIQFRGTLDVKSDEPTKCYDVNFLFPRNVLDYFTLCITNLASWQVMNLVKTFQFHFDAAVNNLSNINEDPASLFYMEILSTLMCWTLSSVRMAEHTVTSSVVQKFVTSLEEIRDILKKFGKGLLHKPHNHILLTAFLNVSYTWGEIYMALVYYSINNEVTIKTYLDNDYSSCNITYLHAYLSVDEWCLIAERISNFGGKPCKEIMQKLLIQKLRAILIFEENLNEDLITPVVKTLCTNLEDTSLDLLKDQFIINKILNRMSTNSIAHFSDCILKKIIDDNDVSFLKHFGINNSVILVNGMTDSIMKNISSLMRQKRKHGEEATRIFLFTKIYSSLPDNIFLQEDISKDLTNVSNVFVKEISKNLNIDSKINVAKISMYLNVLRELPIIFCTEDKQNLTLLLILSLQKDVGNVSCETNIKQICADMVMGIFQSSKMKFLNLIGYSQLINIIINNFDKYDELFSYFIEKVFKTEESIREIKSGITYVIENFKENHSYIKCGLITLHAINKVKKSKMSTETKQVCLKYKSVICNEIMSVILENEANINLIEPFAILLKTFLSKDEENNLEKLRKLLNIYLEYSLSNVSSNTNIKGHLLLFTTILHHKSVLNEINENVVLKIWNVCKLIKVEENYMEEYSHLINLIFGLISNNEISNITKDLLDIIVELIGEQNFDLLINYLKTCSSILTCNFNPTKIKILQEFLENILEHLIVIIKPGSYNELLIKQIINFETIIIQTTQFLLTSTIIDLLLLSVTTLMMKRSNFTDSYKLSISLLENLLKWRKPFILDRLPPYLQQYRILLKELCVQSNSDLNLDQAKIQEVSDCAHQLEKLTKNLIACSKDMMRISPYLIADILDQYEQVTLYPNVKIHLNNCIYSLISLCDQHAVSYLMRVLSSASTEIFKMMYENYKKYYRFTGKV